MPEPTDAHLRPTDAFIWYLERDPRLRWTVSAVFVLDHAPPFEAVVARFEQASHDDHRFRSRLADAPWRLGPPRWVPDEAFDLAYHLRHVRAPEPGRLEDVLIMAAAAAMGGLDHSRPLWQATLVDGLADGRAALVFTLNHALTDGIGGLEVATHLFDLEPIPPEPAEATAEVRPAGSVSGWALARQALGYDAASLAGVASHLARAVPSTWLDFLRDPGATVRSALRTTGSILNTVRPILETKSPVMVDRSTSRRYSVLDVPSQALHDAGHAAGGSMNDAFMAGVTGGLRRYHERHGAVPDDLRVSLPISLRTPDDPPGGNRVIVIRYDVPVAVADPAERIQLLREATTAARNEPAVPLAEAIFGSLNPITPWAVAPMALHMDMVTSNVPGYRFPVYLAGAEVLQCYPFGPTGGSAVNVTLMSYQHSCGVGVTMDPAAVPDGDELMACLVEGFEEVLDLAGSHRAVVAGSVAAA